MAKILVAEDEKDIRDLVVFALRFAGYDLVSASNGEEAVQMAREEMPDLILLDVRMPRMSGYDACKILKADKMTESIPIIFLTAKGQETEIRAGLAAGAAEYLLKPFALDDLTQKVKELLTTHD
ncbi:MAG: response regulator [Anaerolineaceae bacterium]|jgi:CheY-like chemotaxis protein